MMNCKSISLGLLLMISFVYCHAQNYMGDEVEINRILGKITDFSNAVMNSDHVSIGNAYTVDAKIFPGGKKIIKGKEGITEYWENSVSNKIPYHKILPEEIKITGNEAYDYGYYEGSSFNSDGEEVKWKGKYVIVWKKVDDDWKIYLDIWNRVMD